jgi:hypothetical protein
MMTSISFKLLMVLTITKSRDSSVGIATRLRAGRPGFQGSIPGGGSEFFSPPPRPDRI